MSLSKNKKTAFVFPGQGSQSVGMLSDLANKYTVIKQTFDSAGEILGYDLWELVSLGSEEKLNQTEFTQPALLAAGFALWQAWQEKGGTIPDFLAGHSLGEYTALVCAESLNFASALQLVADRGRFMQEAVPQGKGAMAAIIGLADEEINSICKSSAKDEVLNVANYNSIGQTVLAGEILAIERAVAAAKNAGAKIAKVLSVSVPSHCHLMRFAADKLAERLQQISIQTPKIPVVCNADVSVYTNADDIRSALVRQLYSPVRWVETVLFLTNSDVDTIYECGPGKVLTGLNKRIDSNLILHSLASEL